MKAELKVAKKALDQSRATRQPQDSKYALFKEWELDLPSHNKFGKRLADVSEEDREKGRRLCFEYATLSKEINVCWNCDDNSVHTYNHIREHYASCMTDAMHWFLAIHPKYKGKISEDLADRLRKAERKRAVVSMTT